MNEPRRTRPQVTVEDLFRLKRAERPPAAFWQEFERELHVKQLAAIVEPRPWWAPLIRFHARFARYQLPVGATAILALTLVTVREYRLPEAEASFAPATPVARLDAMPGPAVELAAQDEAELAAASAAAASANEAATETSRGESFPDGLSQRLSMLGGAEVIAAVDTPSARSIAANLAAVKASEPELARYLDHIAGLEARSQVNRSPAVDPMVNMQSPSDARRARVLSTALPVAASSAADVSERRYQPRLGRDLTDERLYERVSRIDLEGKRLAINFKL